jgi:hypothetical protein
MDNPEQNKNSELVLQHQVYRLYFIDDPQHWLSKNLYI